jgi:alkyldihydroxyacetonephosphate synthase
VPGPRIGGHHAAGRDHRPWYDAQRADLFAAALAAARKGLYPAGVLDPGGLLPGRPVRSGAAPG